MFPFVHIVGRKDHGKTTLVLELVEHLAGRGLRVGTIKHTSHVHELDTPESDSCRHRRAGAAPAAIVTGQLMGLFLPRTAEDDYRRRLAPMFAGCDLVLIEGDLEGPGPKVEVWREALRTPCLASARTDIAAVVTDDPLDVRAPVWARRDVAGICQRIRELAVGRS